MSSTETAPACLPAWVNPDLDRLMVVKQHDDDVGGFRSWAESLVDLPAGAVFARITGVSVTWPPSWSSVQAGRDLHVELNSDLVFTNHSCAPTLEWDMEQMEVRVSGNRDLKKGDLLSFFYPSTEWEMAQPFDCWCGAGEDICLGRVEGAAKLNVKRLEGYWVNKYIRNMLEEASGESEVEG